MARRVDHGVCDRTLKRVCGGGGGGGDGRGGGGDGRGDGGGGGGVCVRVTTVVVQWRSGYRTRMGRGE